MSWKNDVHGQVVSCREIKLYKPSHTLGMKLSQLAGQKGTLRIITYSLPDIKYIAEQISRRPYNAWLICHEKFTDKAKELKRQFPKVQISIYSEVHTKLVLIGPKTVYIGSANFGKSGWHEAVVGMRSEEIHDWYVDTFFQPLWQKSQPI